MIMSDLLILRITGSWVVILTLWRRPVAVWISVVAEIIPLDLGVPHLFMVRLFWRSVSNALLVVKTVFTTPLHLWRSCAI